MADMLNVNPTRGNLLNLKNALAEIRSRHDLLDRKREVLVKELIERLDEAQELEDEMMNLFREAHASLQIARMHMGSNRIDWVTLTPTARSDVRITLPTIMGLRIPEVDLELEAINPPYGLSDTSATLDEAREKWMEVLQFLAGASETFSAVWRLAIELRKTQRLVNALENTLIPRYRNTIDYIEDRLEEDEREDLVYAKKIQEMQGK